MRILGEPEKDEREEPQQDGFLQEEGGGSRRMLFVAILIVLAFFGYLYFFTDLIRSHEEPQRQAEVLLRKPLPRKGGPLGAQSTSVKAVVKPPPVKPAPPAVSTVTKPQPQKAVPPPVPPVKPAAGPESAATVAGGGKYAIQCGPFASTSALVPARTALKKAGFNPVSSPGPKQPTLMYRLFVAGYSDAAVAVAERNKLLEATPDAFVLPHDGNFELFAGSYHEEGRAAKMQDRLSARGVKVERRQVTAPVATTRLTAGAFPTRDAAVAVVERLKKDGVACSVTQRDH